MHEYYAKNASKFKKDMGGLLKPIAKELAEKSGKPYAELFEEIWAHYETNLICSSRRQVAKAAIPRLANPGNGLIESS